MATVFGVETLFAAALVLHGIAHVVGFLVPFRLISADDAPYHTTLLAGRMDVGDFGIKVVGVVWLLTAVAFAVAAWAVLSGWTWGLPFLAGLSVFSLGMCALEWPLTRIGAIVNVAILIGTAWAIVA